MSLLNSVSPRHLGRTMLVSRSSQGWYEKFPRHFELGQSVQTISGHGSNMWNPKAKMTAESLARAWQSEALEAVLKFPDDDLDYTEAEVMKITRTGPRSLTVMLSNSQSLRCERAILCTGIGPEKDLSASGVVFLNHPTGPRVTLDETTTALKAISQPAVSFAGQSLLIYGGGATAAWVAELAIANGVRDLRWVARDGFASANPGGRNNEVMALTKDVRRDAKLDTVKFLGDLSSGSGLEAALTFLDTQKSDVWKPQPHSGGDGIESLGADGHPIRS